MLTPIEQALSYVENAINECNAEIAANEAKREAYYNVRGKLEKLKDAKEYGK